MNRLNKIIDYMENTTYPLSYYIFTFFLILVLRYFGEGYSQEYNYLNLDSFLYFNSFLHAALFDIALALGLIWLCQLVIINPLDKISRFILSAFTIVLITPIIDVLYGMFFQPYHLMYIQPGIKLNLLYSYLTFFGGFPGISLGLKTEIIVAVIGFYLYFRKKNLSRTSSFIWAWTNYSLIFLFASSPLLIKWTLEWIGLNYTISNTSMINFFSFLSLIFSALIYAQNTKQNHRQVTANFFYQYTLLFLILFLGCFLAFLRFKNMNTSVAWWNEVILHTGFFIAALILFSASKLGFFFHNNIAETLVIRDWVLISLAITLVALLNSKLLFLFTLYILLAYIFYLPPFSCRRVPLFFLIICVFRGLVLLASGYILMLYPSI